MVTVEIEHDFLPEVSEFFFREHASPSCLCGEEYFEVCVDVVIVESLTAPVGGDGFFFAFVFEFNVYCSVGLCGIAVRAVDESVEVEVVDLSLDVGVLQAFWTFDDVPLDCWFCHVWYFLRNFLFVDVF